MIQYISEPSLNFFLGLAGIALSLAGIWVSFYFKPNPEPLATIKAEQALTWADNDELPKFIEIHINKKIVPHVARAMIRFWNNGRATLGKELIPEHDKLRLVLENGGEFLAIKITRNTKAVCLCNIEIDAANPSEAIISFDHLDKDDGMIISALHTAPKAMPLLKGTVKGSKVKVIEEVIRKSLKGRDRWIQPLFTVWLPIIAGVILTAFSLWPNSQANLLRILLLGCYQEGAGDFSFNYRIYNFVVGVVLLWIVARQLWVRRRRYPKALA